MAKSTVNLDKLSVKELKEIIEKAEKAIETTKKTQLRVVRKQVKQMIKESGYTPADIFPALKAAKTATKVPPKYQNPKNPDQTWTGRGRKPKWVIDFLKKGKLSSLEIK